MSSRCSIFTVVLVFCLAGLVAGAPARAEVTLSNSYASFTFSTANGSVISGTSLAESVHWLDSSTHSYRIWNANVDVTASESDDTVTSWSKTGESVSFNCTNPTLAPHGITISKTYSLSERMLFKTTALNNAGTDSFFTEAWTTVTLDSAFRAPGYYYVPYPHSNAKIPASSITSDTTAYSAVYAPLNTFAVGLVNISAGCTVASYLAGLNGFYAGLWAGNPADTPPGVWYSFNPVLTATGGCYWVMETQGRGHLKCTLLHPRICLTIAEAGQGDCPGSQLV